MKNTFLFLLFLGLSIPLHADYGYSSTDASAAVVEAQARVKDISAKLNDANFNLNIAKLDWQRSKLTDELTQAQAKGDAPSVDKIQQKITNIDHRKDIEKQKHDLYVQLFQARQENDQAKADNIIFQIKELK